MIPCVLESTYGAVEIAPAAIVGKPSAAKGTFHPCLNARVHSFPRDVRAPPSVCVFVSVCVLCVYVCVFMYVCNVCVLASERLCFVWRSLRVIVHDCF